MSLWIKIRHDLIDDGRVVKISALLTSEFCPRMSTDERARRLSVVGALVVMWSAFDRLTVDGMLIGYDAAAMDSLVGIPGWSEACRSAGWLDVTAEGLLMPRFAKHNSESAKKRAKDARRKKTGRDEAKKRVRVSSAKRPRKNGPDQIRSDESVDLDLAFDHRSALSSKETAKTSSGALDPKNGEEKIGVAVSLAAKLFDRIGPATGSGLIIWKSAFSVHVHHKIPEAWVADAAAGVAACKPDSPYAYFRAILAETCKKNGVDLAALLDSVIVPAGLGPGPPPKRATSVRTNGVHSLAEILKNSDLATK